MNLRVQSRGALAKGDAPPGPREHQAEREVLRPWARPPSQQRVCGPLQAPCRSRGRTGAGAGDAAGTLSVRWRPREHVQKQAGISTKSHLGTEAEIGALPSSHSQFSTACRRVPGVPEACDRCVQASVNCGWSSAEPSGQGWGWSRNGAAAVRGSPAVLS